MRNKIDVVKKQLSESIETKKSFTPKNIETIAKISDAIVNAYKKGKKVIWFGNGGSAADAQHLAGELVSKFYIERRGLASIALNTNTTILTAIANDYDFQNIFSRQIEALANDGDVVVGISTSGTSKNVVAGIKEAKKKNAVTVGFTGESGGKLKGLVDFLVNVPSNDTPRIQESHITIGHIICYLVERELFGSERDG
ncbi:MAG: D-sedoheptulose 7-phosphate isomerase [Thermoplasmata archaeon]